MAYFALLLIVAYFTSRRSDNESFFIGNRNSNWMLVAFGMIGTSLSGVTFVSVPGTVGSSGFQYFQVVIGYFLGYIAVAYILLPLYYRMQLTSIYTYLQERIGMRAYKTGSFYFIISRTLGATARLYLVVNILQLFILNNMGIPFWVTAFVILLLILLYTFEGGVKTIVYTDTLQTTFMLLGLVICIIAIQQQFGEGFAASLGKMQDQQLTRVFNFDPKAPGFFLKQILGGAFITIAMTGLDQEMMQKNISVKRLADSQKNVLSLAVVLVSVLVLFLFLGGLLYLFVVSKGGVYQEVLTGGKAVHQLILDQKNIIGDKVFPSVVMQYLPPAIGILFIIALISALFPSADGALTALTSSFCIDILGLQQKEGWSEQQKKKVRLTVHFSFTLVFLVCILIFYKINDNSIIDIILDLAGYTYGPLLGLFAFGIFTKRHLPDHIGITILALLAPVISYILSKNAPIWFNQYQIGIELLLINGMITFAGLFLLSRSEKR